MTEEKTCYNCGNPNCHIPLNSVRINVKEHHETYDWDMEFDCTNHDKWEELKVEEIRTDNTEALKNALERIKELEKENTELKERHAEILEAFASASSGDDFEMAESAREIMEILNIPCYRHGKVVSKLTKAKNHIHRLLVLLTEGKRSYAVIDEARAFLQEIKENDRRRNKTIERKNRAKMFLNEVRKLAESYDVNFFCVSDGASETDSIGNDCVEFHFQKQKEWEK